MRCCVKMNGVHDITETGERVVRYQIDVLVPMRVPDEDDVVFVNDSNFKFERTK